MSAVVQGEHRDNFTAFNAHYARPNGFERSNSRVIASARTLRDIEILECVCATISSVSLHRAARGRKRGRERERYINRSLEREHSRGPRNPSEKPINHAGFNELSFFRANLWEYKNNYFIFAQKRRRDRAGTSLFITFVSNLFVDS